MFEDATLDGSGLPRCVQNLPCVPFPLPRWTATDWVGCDTPSRGSLPRQSGGSASMTSLSRPAQDSLALRPARLQTRHSRAFSPRLRHGRLPRRTAWVATGVNRKLPGRISHPLVLDTLVAHRLSPVSPRLPRLPPGCPRASRALATFSGGGSWAEPLWKTAHSRAPTEGVQFRASPS
jgi:hypothetical protein